MPDLTDHSNYNCVVETDDGKTFHVYANWLHNENLDQWKDWVCYSGVLRLSIDKELNVFNSECKSVYLGSALHGFEMLEQTKCPKNNCTGCTDDLIVAKHAPNHG